MTFMEKQGQGILWRSKFVWVPWYKYRLYTLESISHSIIITEYFARLESPPAMITQQFLNLVVQIVLQDAAEDEPATTVEQEKEEYLDDDVKGGQAMEQRPLYQLEEEHYGHGGPEGPWMDYYPHPEAWDPNMMDMGGGPMHGMNMRPGSRMGGEGHGPFPLGPGMPMRPPGAGPDFAMFPGGPFGMPPFERYNL